MKRFNSINHKSMKNRFLLYVLMFFIFHHQDLYSQYNDDTTFIGTWELNALNETGDLVYVRCNNLNSNSQGFTVNQDETMVISKITAENKLKKIDGTWWSLRMNRFDFQYFDSTLQKMVIEGFEYIDPSDKSRIQRTRYEEIQRTEDSGFTGSWKRISAASSKEPLFEKCDRFESNFEGFLLTENEELTRRNETSSKKKKYYDSNGIWWSTSKNYFDIQYFDKKKKRLIIEGFEKIEGSNPPTIKQTRYEEIQLD